jgi:hypothetical protein
MCFQKHIFYEQSLCICVKQCGNVLSFGVILKHDWLIKIFSWNVCVVQNLFKILIAYHFVT